MSWADAPPERGNMKIINLGKIPSPQLHVLECEECKTSFEVSEKESELAQNLNLAMSYNMPILLKVKCPLCFSYVVFESRPIKS